MKKIALHFWVMLAGAILISVNFDLGIIVFVSGVFIWIYNRSKSPKNTKNTKKKKKINKDMFKMNSRKVTYNGKTQNSTKIKEK